MTRKTKKKKKNFSILSWSHLNLAHLVPAIGSVKRNNLQSQQSEQLPKLKACATISPRAKSEGSDYIMETSMRPLLRQT